ncbi:ABC transporter ATP-binding protein [Planomicrobium sp. YIM 101495]|uniref:ABC transporter ATP-binding protein n=1 Tax=Planomicrobium sp. YIM 101495 TaxID=2665160 RepID=UPI0012B7DE94|nr:ABC transporter ATP-binding protein [Planomicrobium sp. YIM 101495]MTD32061.1 ATP-binding cassette domain-containing protein [Planomicrobium sp. YIM 101495]
METILSVEKIEKYYGNKGKKGNITKAMDDISFQVKEGEFVGIMGPSGSGKTTLLNCISTIDHVTTGKIIINGQDVTGLKKKALETFRRDELGFIFQDFNLLDTLTAYENIALALTIQKRGETEIDSMIQKVAEKLGITEILGNYPFQLSGGQKQRVASARAIVTEPSLILADEPTGALDSKSSNMLLESFEKLNQEFGSTILMVTHDSFTASYANRILFIKDGRIFNELVRGNDTRKQFFNKIIEVVALLGGDVGNVL